MPILLLPDQWQPFPVGAPNVGWTLGDYRHRIAKETGNYLGSEVTVATRNYLQDTRSPIRSTLDQSDLYTGKWLLRPRAVREEDRLRVVAEGGYDPRTGTLRPDNTWVDSPTTGEPYELHGVIEPEQQMLDLINETLKRCMVAVDFIFPVVPGQSYLNLTQACPWLLDPRWVRGAGFFDPSAVDPLTLDLDQSYFRGGVERQGRSLLLKWGHQWAGSNAANTALLVRMIKRAYDDCRSDQGGVFGERSGLATEDNEAPVAEDWVAAGAMTDFWDEFGNVVAAGNRQESTENQGKWAQNFTSLTQQYFQLPPYSMLDRLRRGWAVGAY